MISTHSEYRAATCTEVPAGANPTISAVREGPLRMSSRRTDLQKVESVRFQLVRGNSVNNLTRRFQKVPNLAGALRQRY